MNEFTRGFILAQLTERPEETIRVVAEGLVATLKRCSDYQRQVEDMRAELDDWIKRAGEAQCEAIRALEELAAALRVQRDAALSKFKECSAELDALRAQEPVEWIVCEPKEGKRVLAVFDAESAKGWSNKGYIVQARYAASAPAAVPDEAVLDKWHETSESKALDAALDRCLRNIYDHIQHKAYNDALSSTLEAQKHAAAMRTRAVPDDVAQDAARYRWLRKQNWWNAGEICCVVSPSRAVKLGYDCPSGIRLDSIIDSLLAAAQSAAQEKKP